MPRDPKIFFNGGVHFLSMSVEEGFMFPPNALVKEIILKCAAQAQVLHPVEISDILVESTHAHSIIRVIDPSDVSDFVERFKTETAHAINGLLGRDKRTLWCSGYDSPLIPDLPTLINKISYIYENPSKDSLTDTVDEFPGFNTFHLRQELANGARASGPAHFQTYCIPRPEFSALDTNRKLKENDYQQLRDTIILKKKLNYFEVSPNAIFERFGVHTEEEILKVNRAIIGEVRHREQGHRALRKAEGRAVVGARRLIETPIGATFIPDRKGRRMLVHSDNRELRKTTINWMRDLIKNGKKVLEKWRQGDFSVPYPMGLFPPTGRRLVEPIGW